MNKTGIGGFQINPQNIYNGIPWNKGKKLSEKHRENLSLSHKGKSTWCKGLKGIYIPGSEKGWFKKGHKYTGWNNGKQYPKELYPNYGMRGKRFTEETKLKMSSTKKGKLPKNFDLFFEKRMKGFIKNPTKLEKEFIELIEKNNLPYKYVGNMKFRIGTKNPDFINEEEKKCIEIRNREVCKRIQKITPEEYEKQRIDYFNKYGWKCFVFFENDLNNPKKIITTIGGGVLL